MTMRLASLTLSTLLVACAASGPRDGEWSISNSMLEQNECNLDEELLATEGRLNVRDDGDDTFTVALQDDDFDPITCTLDGDDFDCAPLVDNVAVGVATAELSTTIAGTFSDSENASVNQSVVADCQGAGCDLAATFLGTEFPCEVRVSYEIAWVAEDLGELATEE